MPESSYSILYDDSGPSIVYGTGNGPSQDESFSSTVMASGQPELEALERPPPESNPREVLTQDCLLLPSDLEDSETQVPPLHLEDSETQVPPLHHVGVPVTRTESSSESDSDDQVPPPVVPPPLTNLTTTVPKSGRRSKSAPSVQAPSSLPAQWSDNTAIYPTPHDIAEALQDPGKTTTKTVNGNPQRITSFPLIQKMCSKISQQIQALYNPVGLTKNSTRARDSLVHLVLVHRKLQDVMNVDVYFHRYACNGQVFIIKNDIVHCGLDVPIREFQAMIADINKRAKACRTSNDGLRLALSLLDPKYRDAVSLVMANRKDRIHSDISGDHVLHLFEELLVDSFKNQVYKPPQPDPGCYGDIDANEVASWDPNDPKIFEVDRTATWLVDTWKLYVRKKYKAALDRWNKETGGGNGQPWSFVNYCDRDARWLVMVFLMDRQVNYLLASNAGGRMPSHLQMELSSLGSTSSSEQAVASLSIAKRKQQEAEMETKKLKSEMMNSLAMFNSMCQQRHNEDNAPPPRPPPDSNMIFDDVVKCNHALNDTVTLNSMSPRTRDQYVSCLQARRKRLIAQMIEMEG